MGLKSLLAKIAGRKFIRVQAPPARFVKTGTVTVQFVDPKEVAKRCKDEGALACAVGRYLIIMPDIRDLDDAEIGALLRHEVAHTLGGWDHEKA